jgi:Phosphoinositide phospholipase C, Ca2+-dependent
MLRRSRFAVVVAVAAGLASTAGAASGPPAGEGPVRLNELQAIGTHNSYKRELSEPEQAEYDEIIATPGDYDEFLAYSHASIPDQFGRQDVRGLELDLFGDPNGGLYAEPLVRKRLGLGPLPDPAWRVPGVKVLHIADLDYETTCVLLVTCLEQVDDWSDANPGHVPLTILLELKRSDARAVAQGGVVAPPWTLEALEVLDAEIRSVFSEGEMITPDDVRRPGLTLEQSVLLYGWPSLKESRGQVVFLLDNDPGPIRTAYTAGRPNLEGRVIFTNSRAGQTDAAFIKRNEPRGANTAQIQDLVRKGYLVRTRSDLPLSTVRSGDTAMLQAALASGAHVISTDFPEVGMSARYGSDFVARLPEGVPARCNPVNARPNCKTKRLE